ncbi:hypothetical protein V498_07207 [Pseudogymnoascus sp. VKM F-4517 (FW-2822)]|nr:hypothetical protein V498_07207 [Pseudogymnoascus sp. VKM F-4517 (FW-2822)]
MFEYFQETTPTSLWCMCLASIGAFLFGFDNGWWGTIQGVEPFLRDYGTCQIVNGIQTCNISTSQRAAGSSVQSGGIMVGSLLALYINQRLGRKMALVLTGMISIVGILLEVTSGIGSHARFSQFVVGKSVASIAMGLAANIVPIYLSETSSSAARGSAINMYQNVQIIGFVLAAGVVYASTKRDDSASYFIPLGIQFAAPTAMIVLTPLLPESPRWLAWKGRSEEAIKSADKLFGTPTNGFDAVSYVGQIEISIEADRLNPESSNWRDLCHGPNLRRLLIAIGIQCFLQAQGSSYIINYMVRFLNDTGITNVFPCIMGLNCTYYAGILTGHFLPDRYGRRPVLIWSVTWCGLFMLLIASVATAVSPSTSQSSAAALAILFLWQLASGVMSPLVWIVCTEAAPTRNREKVLSVALFVSFGVSLLIASVSPYIQDPGFGNMGSRIGFIWGTFSIIAAIWSYFMVPETKGRSLEQLDYLYDNQVPTREFVKYKFADEMGSHTTSDEKVDGRIVVEMKA